MTASKNWPAWYNSPDGEHTEVFASADEVPSSWTTGAEKAKPKAEKVEDGEAASAAKKSKSKANKADHLDL